MVKELLELLFLLEECVLCRHQVFVCSVLWMTLQCSQWLSNELLSCQENKNIKGGLYVNAVFFLCF